MMKTLRFYLLFLMVLPAFSQGKDTVEEVFDKVEKKYKSEKSYCYQSQYNFYNTATATKPVDSYTGTIYKNNAVSYQQIKDTEFASFGANNILINHQEKIVQIGKVENNNSPIALKSFLKLFPDYSLKQDKTYYICELKSGKYSQVSMDKLIIYINKADYSLVKQNFYFMGEKDFMIKDKKIKIKNPKLEVHYKKNPKCPEIKQQDFFTVKDKKFIVTPKLKDYKAITL